VVALIAAATFGTEWLRGSLSAGPAHPTNAGTGNQGSGASPTDSSRGGQAGSPACGVKLGFFGSLSGNLSLLVPEMDKAAVMAVERYNAAHQSCTVTLITLDANSSLSQVSSLATSAAQDQKVVGIIGPAYSAEAAAALPIFDRAGLPVITSSATRPDLSSKGWKTFHRGVGSDVSEGSAAGRYARQTLNATRAFLVNDGSLGGKGFTDGATTALSGAVVGTDTVVSGQSDFTVSATKVKSANAAVVFFGGQPADASGLLRALRSVGWQGVLIGQDGLSGLDTRGVNGADGTLAVYPTVPGPNASASFVSDYQTRYGAAPAAYSAITWDVTNVFLEAIGGGIGTRSQMQSFLGSYHAAGVATKTTFTWMANGELDPGEVVCWVYEAQRGSWVPKSQIA